VLLSEKEERPTPVMMNDRLKREKWGDAERPFPDIPSRKEEWRAENARLAARMRQNSELQKEAEAAAKAAEKAAERRAAGMDDAIGAPRFSGDLRFLIPRLSGLREAPLRMTVRLWLLAVSSLEIAERGDRLHGSYRRCDCVPS
jgi:hypothetical protein